MVVESPDKVLFQVTNLWCKHPMTYPMMGLMKNCGHQ